MASEHWFKPKKRGYGCTPANWKGWLATLVFCAAIVGIAWSLTGDAAARENIWTWVLFAVGVILLIAIFVRIAKAKTDGEWRWRWGNRNGQGHSGA